MNARLRVVHAGPLVTFQDGGRPGHLRHGIAMSGPMDRVAHAAANVALGRDPTSTAIEVSPGGLRLRCESGEASVALTGAGFVGSWQVVGLRAGDEVELRAGTWGSWAYVAVLGELEADRWLGHTSTHTMAGLGGGVLATGDTLHVGDASLCPRRAGEIPPPTFHDHQGPVRVVLGPQVRHFTEAALERFVTAPFALTTAYDRMGVRLDGPELTLDRALSIPSEPIVRGSVQVGGDGTATVLLADHQTTGGYPKIATVLSCDLDRFVQLRSSDEVRFAPVEAAEAIAAAREHATRVRKYLESIARPGRTLAQRLMLENLIPGGSVEG